MKKVCISLVLFLFLTTSASAYTVQWAFTMKAGSGPDTNYAWCFNGGVASKPKAWVLVPGFSSQPPSEAFPYKQDGVWVIKMDSFSLSSGVLMSKAHNTDDLFSNLHYLRIECN